MSVIACRGSAVVTAAHRQVAICFLCCFHCSFGLLLFFYEDGSDKRNASACFVHVVAIVVDVAVS